MDGLDRASSKAKDMLDLVDNLRSMGCDQDFPIPQIAVMGDQSSGKSSVLESISGIPFPRGQGTVTTCATQIRMRQVGWDNPAKGSTVHIEGTGPVDRIEDLGTRISQISRSLTSNSSGAKGVNKDASIIINISGPRQRNLTLVDLPGMIRLRPDGFVDTVIDDIDALLEKYMRQPHTVILAVMEASADIALASVLEKAHRYDVTGDRTIAVLTKADRVESGCEGKVVDLINGKTKPLKMGYLLVRNRTAEELERGISLEDSREREANYFRDHPVFSRLLPNLMGVSSLSERLTHVLVDRIEVYIPEMRNQIEAQLRQARDELKAMGDFPDSEIAKKHLMHAYVKDFEELVKGSIDGTSYTKEPMLSDTRLRIAVAVHNEYFDEFKRQVRSVEPNFDTKEHRDSIAQDIKQSRVVAIKGFIPVSVLQDRVGRYVRQWNPMAERVLDDVDRKCRAVGDQLAQHVCPKYSGFRGELRSVLTSVLDDLHALTKAKIGCKLEEEMSSLQSDSDRMLEIANTRKIQRLQDALRRQLEDMEFEAPLSVDTLAGALPAWFLGKLANRTDDDEEAVYVEDLLFAYWQLSFSRYADSLVQIVEHSYLHAVHRRLSERLTLSCEGKLDALFVVNELEHQRRQNLVAKIERLEQARNEISKR